MMVVWYTHNKYRYPGTVASSKIDTHKKVVHVGEIYVFMFQDRSSCMYEMVLHVRTSLATTPYYY
jgi:hypothetical protein